MVLLEEDPLFCLQKVVYAYECMTIVVQTAVGSAQAAVVIKWLVFPLQAIAEKMCARYFV